MKFNDKYNKLMEAFKQPSKETIDQKKEDIWIKIFGDKINKLYSASEQVRSLEKSDEFHGDIYDDTYLKEWALDLLSKTDAADEEFEIYNHLDQGISLMINMIDDEWYANTKLYPRKEMIEAGEIDNNFLAELLFSLARVVEFQKDEWIKTYYGDGFNAQV